MTHTLSTKYRKAPCVILPRSEGENFRRRLDAHGYREKSLKIKQEGNRLLIPLTHKFEQKEFAAELKQPRLALGLGKFEVLSRSGARNLGSLLADLGSSKMSILPRTYDILGDIAIIQVSPDLDEDASRIGQALMMLHKRLKTVYAKAGPVTGESRVRSLRCIAGEEKAETIHRENGCQYRINVFKAFFNPRLGGERLRIAKQVSSQELVLDMFAGVGPFSILIAKRSGAKVHALDSNPVAIRLLRENVQLNHVEERVRALKRDASQLPDRFKGKIDRVIMNLPERSAEFVANACEALKPSGGILHYYSFQKDPGPVRKAEKLLGSKVSDSRHRIVKILTSKAIREIAPRTYFVCVDAKIR